MIKDPFEVREVSGVGQGVEHDHLLKCTVAAIDGSEDRAREVAPDESSTPGDQQLSRLEPNHRCNVPQNLCPGGRRDP
jgi:hypothetical protein